MNIELDLYRLCRMLQILNYNITKVKANALIGRLAICPLVHVNEKLQPVAKVLETLYRILV